MTTAAPEQVTLVISTLDRPKLLDRCLRAVLAGVALPSAVIVVEQGAGDVAPAVRAAFRERSVAFERLRMRRRGVSRGRNFGVSHASTKLVAFTDDDCVPDPHWLAALVNACRTEIGGVSGRVLPLPSSEPDLIPASTRLSTTPMLYRGLKPHAPWDAGTGGNLLLRRQVFDQIGGFDEELGPGTPNRAAEDIDLLYRLLRAGHAIAYAPDAVILHEMKPRRDHLRVEVSYGFGMGAFLGRHVSAGDREAAALLRRYCRDRAGKASVAIRKRDGQALAGAAMSMIGMARGFARAWLHGATGGSAGTAAPAPRQKKPAP